MVILLAGGGTAGHVNPAISIAAFIKARRPDAEIHFAGTPEGIENRLVADAGFPMHHVEIYGFKRSLSLQNIKTVTHLVSSVKEAAELIKTLHPDLVIGTGGYVSGPVVLAASRAGIPTAIHEQNAYPGITTRMLSRVADRVMISFEESRRYLKHPDKAVLCGNPVRSEMGFLDRAEMRRKLGLDERPFVVSFGGSLGARELNLRILDFIELHRKEGKIQHLHATGAYGWRWMPGKLRERGIDFDCAPDLQVVEYIRNMPELMAAADLVITRAGAITLGEIAICGMPSILIPSPNVTNNHQYHNAMSYQRAGASLVMEEKNCTGADIFRAVTELVADKEKLAAMKKGAESLAVPDSTQRIYDVLFDLMKTK